MIAVFPHEKYTTDSGRVLLAYIRATLKGSFTNLAIYKIFCGGAGGATHAGQRQTRLPFTPSILRRRPAAGPYLGAVTLSSAPHIVANVPSSRRFIGASRPAGADLRAPAGLTCEASLHCLVPTGTLLLNPRGHSAGLRALWPLSWAAF